MSTKIFKTFGLSPDSYCSSGESCLDDKVKNAIADVVNVSPDLPEKSILEKAKYFTNCANITCTIKKIAEKSDVVQEFLPLIFASFKTRGPHDSTELLSNINIDAVLSRWAAEFNGFFNCQFSMMDFHEVPTQFGKISLANVMAGKVALNIGPNAQNVYRPADCFACVLNTDFSGGGGKHWVCVFVDCRPGVGKPWTIEYFNSTGNPPCSNIIKWMENAKEVLTIYRKKCCVSGTASDAVRSGVKESTDCSEEIAPGTMREVKAFPVSNVCHQESNTECGLYALFYIRARLTGHSYEVFRNERIKDADMILFRQYIFRS